MAREKLDWLVTITLGDPHGAPIGEAKLIGVFDEPMRANRLCGLLAAERDVRSVMLYRVGRDGGHVCELVMEGWRVDQRFWNTQEGCWEVPACHEIEIIQWHLYRRDLFKQGVDWTQLPNGEDVRRAGLALGASDRIPASSASAARSGPSHEQPSGHAE